jgi:mannuronan 5-epimerase
VNIVIVRITKTSVIFLVCILFGGILNVMISPSSFIIGEVQAQKAEELEKKEEKESVKEKCISYDKPEKLISITCKYADFEDVTRLITDPSILKLDTTTITTNTNTFESNNEKVWLLDAGLKVEENALLDINSNDVTWLKIIPTNKSPNAIEVDGNLKVDSVKITSWNPKTNDYVKFSEKAKEDASIYTMIPRPYIKIEEIATGPTKITNSELAYLGYSCNGCGGLTFYGGENSILKNNDIHHIYKGFYSKEMGYMLIEGNRVYDNERYGIDPHTGTYNMTIRNNTIYDNGYSGIICSLNCYNIIIEDNEVYNNGNTGKGRGIAFSINMFDSVARNNYVHHQNIGIDISGESHDNKVYNNKISNSKVGIETSEKSSNNNLYNNAIINSINGIVVKTGASDNTFYLNKIVNATEFGILNVKGDPGTVGNTFENNKLINSKVNTSVTTSTMALDENDNADKDDGDNQDEKEKE